MSQMRAPSAASGGGGLHAARNAAVVSQRAPSPSPWAAPATHVPAFNTHATEDYLKAHPAVAVKVDECCRTDAVSYAALLRNDQVQITVNRNPDFYDPATGKRLRITEYVHKYRSSQGEARNNGLRSLFDGRPLSTFGRSTVLPLRLEVTSPGPLDYALPVRTEPAVIKEASTLLGAGREDLVFSRTGLVGLKQSRSPTPIASLSRPNSVLATRPTSRSTTLLRSSATTPGAARTVTSVHATPATTAIILEDQNSHRRVSPTELRLKLSSVATPLDVALQASGVPATAETDHDEHLLTADSRHEEFPMPEGGGAAANIVSSRCGDDSARILAAALEDSRGRVVSAARAATTSRNTHFATPSSASGVGTLGGKSGHIFDEQQQHSRSVSAAPSLSDMLADPHFAGIGGTWVGATFMSTNTKNAVYKKQEERRRRLLRICDSTGSDDIPVQWQQNHRRR